MKKQWLLPILVLGILLLSMYLRLYRIDEYLTFLGDEGRDVLRVKQMLVEGDFIFLGPTASVGGFFLGPFYYYLMAPFLWLWQYDPVGPAVMVALFGVATVFLVYFIGSKFFHPVVGLVASLLYGLSPITIAYSRSSWNPNVLPFFTLIYIYLLWVVSTDKRRFYYLLIGVTAGVAIQLHYLFSFVIISSIIWLLWWGRPKQMLQGYGLIILGGLITLSPLVLFELRYGFPNLQAMVRFLATGNETGFALSSYVKTVSDVVFRSFGRLLFRMPNYELWNGYPDEFIAVLVFLVRTTILIGGTTVFLAVVSGVTYKQRRLFLEIAKVFRLSREQYIAFLLLSLWFIVSVALFGFYRKGIYDYYFGIFYAVPFFIVGIVAWQTMRTKSSAIVAGLCICGLVIYNWEGRPFVFEPNRQLQQTKQVSEAVLDMAQGKPFNFAFITATNSDHAYRYFFEVWKNPPVVIENTDIDPQRRSVTDQLIVMCEQLDCKPLGNPLWEVAGFGRAEIVEERYVFPVYLFKLRHYDK